MVEPGALVAGKLRIERVLGKGGMGTVVVATHIGLDQRVALKILHPEIANQPDVVARFVREARASAKLRSEHVCRVTDVGELEDGRPYIEMELLDGRDLSSRIAEAPLAPETAADFVAQACIAIAEAHALGIVHRDLKPGNLFVTQRLDGTPLIKVLDFGIATAPADELKITTTTTVMGSPGYMSPEHLRSARDVDVRSDIWSLGVILYEAVSGRLPFFATTITELAVKVVMDPPEPLPGIDPRFVAIIDRCLQKVPAQRYPSVAELAADLGAFGGPSAQTSAQLVARVLGASRSQPIAASSLPSGSSALPAGLAQTMATQGYPTQPAPGARLGYVPPPGMTAPPQGFTQTMPPSGAQPLPGPQLTGPMQPPQITGPMLPPGAQYTLPPNVSGAMVPPAPPSSRRTLVFGMILGCVAIGGAALAFALVDRADHKPEHRGKHVDAGLALVLPDAEALVSQSGPAPPAPPTAPTARDEVSREVLAKLEANQDYRAILAIADDADDDDPAVASIVTDAKSKYLAQQTKEIADHVARGECAAAKLEADDGAKVLPDSEDTFESIAAGCKPKPKTVGGVAAAKAAAAQKDDQAAEDYTKGDVADALALAKEVLKSAPDDAAALGIAARAACDGHDVTQAKAIIAMLPDQERASVQAACDRENPPTATTGPNPAITAARAATKALAAKDWATAEKQAKAALAKQPNSREALYALAIASCRLGKTSQLEDVLAKAPALTVARIKRACPAAKSGGEP